MKRISLILTVLLISTFMLVACSDDKDEAKESDNNVVNEENNDENDKNNAEKDDDSKDNDDDSDKSSSEIITEDQLDLKLGDTGKFDTTLGTYEMTVMSAKLLDSEFEGIESQLDRFILLDIKVKNTSNNDLKLDDIMASIEITEDLEGSGFGDSSGAFDSIEELTGEIKPGEEIFGQFITEVYDSDVYYFREGPGVVAAGWSNQVIWTIPADEAK
ncbi:hypothetical protein HNQ35_002277 [Cerasibacillus quisquiliarum]|uniref:DUF4352 domain-containing protein n=1 Tax=Cerasibacillus quisquiliarum TaxID=227865 RepID=A0A511V0S8_9BACI|nr:hypothetical protein [Cerasibacillus quisquiliarum]MBB5147060.1 hypothetical protein [Cerasibacillus quisquiliarum]GEN32514.1 hypothetical protein CQU01_27520 [Cerasibacillus quisquiliarum]